MNRELIKKAKEAGKGNWWNTFGPYLLLYAIFYAAALVMFLIPIAGIIVYILGVFMLAIGYNAYLLNLYKGEGKLKDVFMGFNSKNIGRWLKFFLWFALLFGCYFVIFGLLASLPKVGTILAILFEIPYLIICFGISQCTFILIEHPEMKTIDIFKESWRMMKGHKWRYFWLSLRIVGIPLILMFIGYPLIMLVVLAEELALQALLLAIGLPLVLAGLIWTICIFGRITLFPVVFYETIKGEKTPIGPSEETLVDADPVVL